MTGLRRGATNDRARDESPLSWDEPPGGPANLDRVNVSVAARQARGKERGEEIEPLSPRLALAGSFGLFAALWLLQTLAAFASQRGGPADRSLPALLAGNALYYLPWMLFATALAVGLDRRRDQLLRPARVAAMFVACLLAFFVPYLGYEVAVGMLLDGVPLAAIPAQLPAQLGKLPPFVAFVDLVLFVGCFGSVQALVATRGHFLRERRQHALEEQMSALRLELERQRLAAIQAQLEPHFLFNALNAISALVRTRERESALSALARLSGLLRYALTASRRDEVTLGEELDFVRDYLELQRLRHGDRLQVQWDVGDASLGELGCPPLILQPLVENALRHGLETHEDPSDVALRVEPEGGGVRVTISNPLPVVPAPNPGLGLGLAATRERLALRYGDRASVRTSSSAGRFVTILQLPEASDG